MYQNKVKPEQTKAAVEKWKDKFVAKGFAREACVFLPNPDEQLDGEWSDWMDENVLSEHDSRNVLGGGVIFVFRDPNEAFSFKMRWA